MTHHRSTTSLRFCAVGVAITCLPLFCASSALAQSEMACGVAVSQLQSYVQQVNATANYEYAQGIPARCGYNGYCAQSLLQQLSAWYAHQSMLVNQWYSTIGRQCSTRRVPTRSRKSDPTEEIEDVDDVQVDDEDKTVRIRIPSKPNGYRGRTR